MTVDTRPGTCALEPFDAALASEWSALADRVAADPFSRPEWVRSWADTIGTEPLVAVVRSGGRLDAAYPMVPGWGRALRSAADWHVPHLDVVGDPESMSALVSGVVARSRRVSFDFATGSTAEAARLALRDAGFLVRDRVRQSSPWIDLSIGWDAYRAALPTRKWSEIRRRRRRLDEVGTVSYEQSDGRSDLERLLDEGLAVEGSGWKDAAGTAVRSDPRVESFYRRVARWAADTGMLRLHFLRLNGRAIAFDLAFVANDAEWLLKTGFDPELFAFSPGSLLRAEALERCFATGAHRYEFLGAAAPWKLEWTAETRDVVVCDGFAPDLWGRATHLGSRVARRVRVMRTGRQT